MPDNPLSSSPAAEEAPERSNAPKRRKVRKGTQSCWECKRRKIRCTFAAPTDAICDGCKSRHTKCISQEYHDDAVLASRKADRLSRVESLVEGLVSRSNTDMADTLRRDHSGQDGIEPVSANINGLDLESQTTTNGDSLSRALLEAWPNQDDLDLILSISVGVSVLFHGVICQSYSKFFSGQVVSPRRMLESPPQGTHPVLIARKLLLLASLLQGIPPCSVDELAGLSSDYHDIMSRAFNTASRLVTSNDELISSLEGIECVMIESMYLNNAGSLRRAWLVNRKAMALAQMMGLHAGTTSSRMVLENETLDRIDPNYMWFRLVLSDRYLCLMLGLPQGSLETVFASLETLDTCVAIERLERIESTAASLILQRNSTERTDLVATHKIDKMLQEAAAVMPPQWWLMAPDLTAIAGSDVKAFEESIRLTNQFAYHHLLVQLHLPYMMLDPSTEPCYCYSKMTAANASRTIISQYVSFRNSFLATAYCRGIDFIAFIASTTLCLAHIEARRQSEADTSRGVTVFQSLQHQRLSDRGLLERTLEAMVTMARNHQDVVARKISSILRPLLAIENNSFKGGHYHVYASSENDKQESVCLGDTTEAFHALHIQIPYFGTIQIEHRPTIPETIGPAQATSEERPWNPFILRAGDVGASQTNNDEGEMTPTARAAGYTISTSEPVNSDWQPVPSCFEPGLADTDQVLSSFGPSAAPEPYLLVPGLEADVDDWALQGVDMALFNSLTHNSVDSSYTE
ncbi:hypothetical protein F4821DRAFT_261450 [Hypoxylon rubiginosum]|uniref:Uncharacterized protein n=1 Tax=Hypoxylon rubiginosum TaxID=110542 RepID=A0ACC0CWZ7_9PEZI|nr:hypothetical protein F4821DRAFT_261450 [Hypoxylon rubiginosum]